MLLTAARRMEAAAMTWGELNGEWTLPASRNVTKVDMVRPLSAEARAVLPAKVDGCDYVFTTEGRNPISNFSAFKLTLDKAILEDLRKQDPEAKPLPNWTLHDLRRTAWSLMSRAGVRADHAERCLGRVMPGVRAVYDPYEYLEEKRDTFNKLAAAIKSIVHPSKGAAWPGKFGMCAWARPLAIWQGDAVRPLTLRLDRVISPLRRVMVAPTHYRRRTAIGFAAGCLNSFAAISIASRLLTASISPTDSLSRRGASLQ
jgi:hypothetical protein